jgi:uncharacterized protein (DUF736 family)
MAYEQRNNSGSLFKNDRKNNERQPDYNGNAIINGKTMRISAWIKKSQNGTTFMSLAFEEANGAYQQNASQQSVPAPQRPAPAPVNLDTDPSDLPFD